MKLPKPLVIISLLSIISFIICEDRREQFANNIKNYVQSRKPTKEAQKLVSGFKNKLTLLVYTLTLKELDKTKEKFDLSDLLINQIKMAPYVRSGGAKKVEEKNYLNFYSYEETIGSAIKEDDGRVSFALIRTRSLAKLSIRYEKYKDRECYHVWIFFKKCKDVVKQREKVLTEYEKTLVGEAAKYSAVKSILEGVDILKRNDYELYMTDTGSIFSPDHKSVAHVTYFGNIAIGPYSELNAVLPIDYEYVDSSFIKKNPAEEQGEKTGLMREFIAGNFTKQIQYPTIGKNDPDSDLFFNSGLFHKFNFLAKKKEITKFPRQYVDYMNKTSQRGPFILEIKKNGNVILYEDKTKLIIWETNTANKGKGPYNLHLTNEKELILEDSNGKILYRSGAYKDIPTILYSNSTKNGRHEYNGLVLNQAYYIKNNAKPFRGYTPPPFLEIKNPINPNLLHIMTDNDRKYHITYGGKYKLSDEWFKCDNRGKCDYPSTKIDKIDLFYATISGNYDICYAARLNDQGWTSFTCNGEKVGLDAKRWRGRMKMDKPSYWAYICSLIIYVKEKGEPLPIITNYEPIIHWSYF